MKKIIVGILTAALFAPVVVSAGVYPNCNGDATCIQQEVTKTKIEELKMQIAQLTQLLTQLMAQKGIMQEDNHNSPSPSASCFIPTYDLYIGRDDSQTNGEVKKLQLWLKDEGYFPDAQGTGYYGNLTANAVMKWQKAHGMDFVTLTSGVGKQTRAKMQEACGTSLTEMRTEQNVLAVTYSYSSPGSGALTQKTEPAFGEGVVIDPQTVTLPTNIQDFTKNDYMPGYLYVMRMLYINTGATINSQFANEQGTVYLACTGSKAVGTHLTYGKTLLLQCNPGAVGMITNDGRSIGEGMWAAN